VTTRADAPIIAATSVAAGHDGRAELVLELAYPNGAHTHLSVTEEAMARALDAAGFDPWTVLFGPDQTIT
jgi:hypothetical protein